MILRTQTFLEDNGTFLTEFNVFGELNRADVSNCHCFVQPQQDGRGFVCGTPLFIYQVCVCVISQCYCHWSWAVSKCWTAQTAQTAAPSQRLCNTETNKHTDTHTVCLSIFYSWEDIHWRSLKLSFESLCAEQSVVTCWTKTCSHTGTQITSCLLQS